MVDFPILGENSTLEFAFGADVEADDTTWTWYDVTADLQGGGWTVERGRPDEGSDTDPGSLTVVLSNLHGHYTPEHPLSPYFPNVIPGTPARFIVLGTGRIVGQISSITPEWPYGDHTSDFGYDPADPLTGDDMDDADRVRGEARVTIVISGRMQALEDGQRPLRSPLYRFYTKRFGTQIKHYWPHEVTEQWGQPDNPEAARQMGLPTAFPDVISNNSLPVVPKTVTQTWPIIGTEDTNVGSDLLPEWRVQGGVAPGDWHGTANVSVSPPWRIECSIRVPVTEADWWPIEYLYWYTDDPTLYEWRLLVTQATDGNNGTVGVEVYNDAGVSQLTLAATTLGNADAGSDEIQFQDTNEWLQVAVEVFQSGSNMIMHMLANGLRATWTETGFTVGRLTRITPRLIYSSVATTPPPMGFGHLAVFRPDPAPGAISPRAVEAPENAYQFERAVPRVVRLATEENIPIRVRGRDYLNDEFGRTEVTGWGTADSGQEWVSLSNGVPGLSVTPGAALLSTNGAATLMYVERPFNDSTVLTKFRVSGQPIQVTNVHRFDAETGLSGDGYALGIFRDASSTSLVMTVTADTVTFTIGVSSDWSGGNIALDTDYWLRTELIGEVARLKLWADGDPEPELWDRVEYDNRRQQSGVLGVLAGSSGNVDVTFGQITGVEIPHSEEMGVQNIDTALSNMKDAAAVDMGILSEDRDRYGLVIVPRESLYNMEPVMTLDAGGVVGEVVNPIAPILDTQGLRNEWTVSRSNGGQAVADDVPHQERHGYRPDSVTVPVASDEQLPGQAAWRLHLSTWPGMRYASLSPALNGVPELISEWLAADIGDRVDVINLPAQHPPGVVSQIIQGYAETVATNRMDATANTSPYGPYEVAMVGDTDGGTDVRGQRVDSDNSVLPSGLVLDGASGSGAATVDEPSFNVGTQVLRVEAMIWPDTWSPAAHETIGAQYLDAANERAWRFGLEPNRFLGLIFSEDGVSTIADTSDDPVPVGSGPYAVAFELDPDTGADSLLRFYTAPTIDGPWNQLGGDETSGAPRSLHDSTAPLEVGARANGAAARFSGSIDEVRVYVGGVLVASPDFTQQPSGTTSFTDAQGNLWTIGGTAVIANGITETDTTIAVRSERTPWTTDPDDWDVNLNGGGLFIRINGELMRVTNITASVAGTQTFTVVRGVEGLVRSHDAGSEVHAGYPARVGL